MSFVWVTGAAGFIGRHLVRHLENEGEQVAGIDLVPMASEASSATVVPWCSGGISLDGLDRLVKRTGVPDKVYHLAGGSSVGASLADPMGDFSGTVNGTAILLDWLRVSAPQTRLVVISSAAVYGDLHRGPIGENSATEPFSPYGAHKYAMETICRGWSKSFGQPTVAVRLFSVYGPGLAKQLLWDLSCRLQKGTGSVMLGGSGEELRDWTHVEDVVRALEMSSNLAEPGMPIVNAGSGRASSVRDVAQGLLVAFGFDTERLYFSGKSRKGDPFSLVAAPATLASLGFEWRKTLDEGLADYVEWFRAEMNR
jgi:UDP-glucose 4-epimerase